ncbi:hypothetical protein N5D79_17150 [Pseudomonas sp. GD03817]|uniref:Uncharacterized protein n=1 Tax=Pseudomonas asiatica TaxID=2219225 RepID=A0AAJ5LJ46_9PSED|nr:MULTISPECIES: hypothetical protein [Pseudomonas]MCE0990474.1 hypothetical protein [Pseudomonas alloputida]MDH1401837.1 hypothetical protein [Pseudomonas sp. GD03730]MDH1776602.1 hypothetical protein [Pseudomonas sp. GD03817]MEE1915487.1 hypothetical protein [Pseudomonas asiatica]UUC18910.1 hypothetical protein NOV18_27390 [Pseudomonas asiatica]
MHSHFFIKQAAMSSTGPFQIRDTYIRVDTMADTYARMAELAFALFLDGAADPSPLFCPPYDPRGAMDQEERKAANGIKTIVFSAMAIEAAVFDLAAIQLGDKVATDYLDKMDLLGKWMIVPRLICGRSLREDGPAVNGLRGLVKARNALVHHKSKEWDKGGKAERAMTERWAKFEKDQVPNAFKTLVLLSLEVDAVLESYLGALPFYGKEVFTDSPRHPQVEEIVQRCREIHQKNWDDS